MLLESVIKTLKIFHTQLPKGTPHGDVYSFGIIMLELNLRCNVDEAFGKFRSGLNPLNMPLSSKKLISGSLDETISSRPTFKLIFDVLRDNETEYESFGVNIHKNQLQAPIPGGTKQKAPTELVIAHQPDTKKTTMLNPLNNKASPSPRRDNKKPDYAMFANGGGGGSSYPSPKHKQMPSNPLYDYEMVSKATQQTDFSFISDFHGNSYQKESSGVSRAIKKISNFVDVKTSKRKAIFGLSFCLILLLICVGVVLGVLLTRPGANGSSSSGNQQSASSTPTFFNPSVSLISSTSSSAVATTITGGTCDYLTKTCPDSSQW